MATKSKPPVAKKPTRQKSTRKKSEPTSLQLPTKCPNPMCQRTDFTEAIPGETVRQLSGTINNFKYKQITWTKRRCQCGQVVAIRTYSQI